MADVYLHRMRCGSWACPGCAIALGRKLQERLHRAEAKLAAMDMRLVMITVTVRRDGWAGPGAAFAESRAKRWIAKAMAKWAKVRGYGDVHYLTKLELQDAGWPHWHILAALPNAVADKLRLPWVVDGVVRKPGEFDEFWPHGLTNVQREGRFGTYASKFVGYAAKEAGKHGGEAVAASELPAFGVHWLQPSHGFWAFVGEEPIDARRDAKRFDDDSPCDDDGAHVGTTVRVVERTRAGTMAERVDDCGYYSVLRIEGAMQDDSGRVGSPRGTISLVLPLRRSLVAGGLEDWYTSGEVRYFDGDASGAGGLIVESVQGVSVQSIAGFLDNLRQVVCPELASVEDDLLLRLGVESVEGRARADRAARYDREHSALFQKSATGPPAA